jgi:hypothetical protein
VALEQTTREAALTYRNKNGLTRTISDVIKREIRKRCGFGCVRCGLAFFDYEHFAPDFKDAIEHRAKGITLLCMQCNQKRARGTLSVETVATANLAPKCLEQGFASESFDFGPDPMQVTFAGVTFTNCPTLIEVNGFPLLSLGGPEAPGAPYRLSGFFADDTGDITLKITDNVWSAGADTWDVECVGPLVTIRNGPRLISLVLRQEPPTRLVIERIDMAFEGIHLRGNDGVLEVSFDGRAWSKWSGCSITNCHVGMSFHNR